MPIIPPKNSNAAGRRPSFSGIAMVDTVPTGLRVRRWPRKRGPSKTKDEKARTEKFAMAQLATKFVAPEIYRWAYNATQGSPLLTRDALTMMFYNRLFAMDLDDGRTLFPMPAIIDVSQSLDVLGKTPGSILYRGASLWQTIPAVPSAIKATMAYRSSNQNLPANTLTPVSFTNVSYDDLSIWNPATPDRLTPPDEAVRVRLTASFTVAGSTGNLVGQLSRNGATPPITDPGFAQSETETGGQDAVSLAGAWVPHTQGDYYGLRVLSTNATPMGRVWLSIEYQV